SVPSLRAAWIMAGLSGVGSGAAAAGVSAKTAPAASTVDALSMSRLESLLSRMFGPLVWIGCDRTLGRVHHAGNSGESAPRHVECKKGSDACLHDFTRRFRN